MSKTDLLFIAIFIAGFLLFLYGANIYDRNIGYSSLYLFMGSMVAYVIITIYKEIDKKKKPC
ncbi:MAG: hypothetical protein GX799_06040 [Crenarchaeota archaeon]|nr:hypothetical protein [Thermoproteota archaeon]